MPGAQPHAKGAAKAKPQGHIAHGVQIHLAGFARNGHGKEKRQQHGGPQQNKADGPVPLGQAGAGSKRSQKQKGIRRKALPLGPVDRLEQIAYQHHAGQIGARRQIAGCAGIQHILLAHHFAGRAPKGKFIPLHKHGLQHGKQRPDKRACRQKKAHHRAVCILADVRDSALKPSPVKRRQRYKNQQQPAPSQRICHAEQQKPHGASSQNGQHQKARLDLQHAANGGSGQNNAPKHKQAAHWHLLVQKAHGNNDQKCAPALSERLDLCEILQGFTPLFSVCSADGIHRADKSVLEHQQPAQCTVGGKYRQRNILILGGTLRF